MRQSNSEEVRLLIDSLQVKTDKRKRFKDISVRDVRQLTTTMVNYPLLTSREVLNQTHKDERRLWAKDNIEIDFSKVVFSEKCRVMLDAQTRWLVERLDSTRHKCTIIKRRQQLGGFIIKFFFQDKVCIYA